MIGSRARYQLALPLALAIYVAAFAPTACRARPEYRAVTILHTNDTHGHLLPFSYPDPKGPKLAYASMPFIKDIGGIARRASLARRIESEMRGNVLLADAGDVLDGTPFSVEYVGEADFAAMSAAGYDIMTLGNHEFHCSLPRFHRNIHIASFPVVCANTLDRKTGELVLPPYKIYNFQGARVAVFGLTVPSPEYQAAQEGLDFSDPYETARNLVPKLKAQADIVVALTHLGSAEDERLAREAPGIDVIIGGHSHARLTTPKLIRHVKRPQAFWVGGTVIVQAYEKGAELGRLDLRLRRKDGPFSLMSYKGELLPITAELPDDPATAQVVQKYYRPMSKYYGEVIGEASATFYHGTTRHSAVLKLVCDAIRAKAGTEIAIYGRGGVRGNILKGPIRVWDIATVLPFQNKIVILKMTGKRLKEALEGFEVAPGASGMQYRIVNGKVVEATVGGKPMQDGATYKVATIDWLVQLYFQGVDACEVLDTHCRDAVIDYVKARKVIAPVPESSP